MSDRSAPLRIVIVGGGFGGLSAASLAWLLWSVVHVFLLIGFAVASW